MKKKLTKETRNSKVLRSFIKFCEKNPDYRFWQALLAWSELPYIAWTSRVPSDYRKEGYEISDTFYWEGRIKDRE